jgi:3-dehydroquinate dehydratase-2
VRVAVLNGPNLNLLGSREPERYGTARLSDVEQLVREHGRALGVEIDWFQSNLEGELVERVQDLPGKAEGALINAAAYTHTSLAVRDALLAVKVPFVEVHLTNVFAREPERQRSLFADLALGVVAGFGPRSYLVGLDALVGYLRDPRPGSTQPPGGGRSDAQTRR